MAGFPVEPGAMKKDRGKTVCFDEPSLYTGKRAAFLPTSVIELVNMFRMHPCVAIQFNPRIMSRSSDMSFMTMRDWRGIR
jgi:hypothetical protein